MFVLMSAASFSDVICFVSPSANMQSVVTQLHMSVTSVTLGAVSATIGSPITSPRRLEIAFRRDASVMPRRWSVGFHQSWTNERAASAVSLFIQTSWMALVASVSQDNGVNISTTGAHR